MSDNTVPTPHDDINDGVGTYDVVVLVEHEVSEADAAQIQGLHAEIGDQVVYHVLVPSQDAAARLEATMGTLGAGDMFVAPLVLDEQQIEAVEAEFHAEAVRQLHASLATLGTGGFQAVGRVTEADPVAALTAAVKADDAREAVVLTSPHLVAEFFHLDWTHQARRRLGVPVLHLVEHETH